MRRRAAMLALALLGTLATAGEVSAGSSTFPDVISLPTGFRPEGIAVGRGSTFYVGSIPTGAIYKGDLRTGDGHVFVPGATGRAATGLKEAGGRLYVSGAGTGKAFIYDARTGDDVAQLTLTTSPSFVNDVVVTRTAAWFTDSVNPVVYRVDRDTLAVTTIPLSGDLQYTPGFNANGIDATPNGKTLVLVQSSTGKLFTADPDTGVTDQIELAGGESLPNSDGVLLVGRTLYVVQNQLNVIAEVRLDHLTAGTVVSRTGNPAFQVPTTIAGFGHRLYAVNARFGIANPGSAEFSVVGFRRP